MGAHHNPIPSGPPKPPVAHLPRIYKVTATALGAGMWFWVSPFSASESPPGSCLPIQVPN